MRREGVKWNIRSNHSLKYCYMCEHNIHVDKNGKCKSIDTTSPVVVLPADCVPIARFTSKPLYTCSHSQGCRAPNCCKRDKPRHKSDNKKKGCNKAAGKMNKDFVLVEL